MPSRLVVFFTAVNILNYLDRALVAAVLPMLIAEMSLTNEQGGRLVSVFVLGYFVFSPVFGYLGDRMRRPPLMALGVLLWSLATIGTGLSQSFAVFVAARILVGIGEASFGSIAPGYLKDRIQDPIKVNSSLSLFYTAIPVGYALGYVTGGYFAKNLTWKHAFFAGGIPGILLAIALLFLKEERREKETEAGIREGLREISRIPIIWYAIGGYVLNSFALSGLAAFVVTYGQRLGFDIQSMNNYFGGITIVGGFFGTMVGGALASKLAARHRTPTLSMLRFVGASALIGTPFLVLAFSVSGQWTFLFLCLVAELMIFAGTAPVNSILVLACPPSHVTLTQGVSIFCLNLFGSLLSPIAVGFVADLTGDLRWGMLLCGLAMLGAGIVWCTGAALERKREGLAAAEP